MIPVTPVTMRIGARRIGTRAVSTDLSAMKANISRNITLSQSRAVSYTKPLSYAVHTNPNPPLGKKNASNGTPSRVGLIGARGYTGQALIDLLNQHPNLDLQHVSSRELKGQNLKGYTKRDIIYENLSPEDVAQLDKDGKVDCWVMALPNGVCKPFIDALDKSSSVIVDLSADYRFDSTWSYGLPELTRRADITQATRISNPGCFATGMQLAISPLVKEHLGGKPTVFGASGYSGAGTKPSPKNDVNLLKDNLMPLASWFRGIHLTISIPLNQTMTSRDVRQIFQDRYAGEPLVKVTGEAPLVKSIQNQHGVEIGGFDVDSSGKDLVVCATIDNLNKGAATQCLQNINLALGYDEYQGIPLA